MTPPSSRLACYQRRLPGIGQEDFEHGLSQVQESGSDLVSKEVLSINAYINWVAAGIRYVIPPVNHQAELSLNTTVDMVMEQVGFIHSSLDHILKMQQDLQATQIWMSAQMLLMQ